MRSPRERLLDMLEAITRIEKYAVQGREAFDNDELIQTYMVHHLQVLGEAAFKLPQSFRDQHRQVPWPKILGMRHVLVHDYFRVDATIVWNVVENELSALKAALQAIAETMSDTD